MILGQSGNRRIQFFSDCQEDVMPLIYRNVLFQEC